MSIEGGIRGILGRRPPCSVSVAGYFVGLVVKRNADPSGFIAETSRVAFLAFFQEPRTVRVMLRTIEPVFDGKGIGYFLINRLHV